MIRLGSLWYNCIHWSRFETLSSDKSSAISDLVIIRLACTKANSYSNFVTHPPSLIKIINLFTSQKTDSSIIQTFLLPPGEKPVAMFQHSETVDSVVNEDVAWMNSAAMSQSVDGLILVTTSGVFQCKPKTSPEKLFLELAVNSADTSAADILAITSGLDVNKLYEVSAQAVIKDFNSNMCHV